MAHYASVNCVMIGSGNGLLTVRHQAITWTNDDLLSADSESSGENFSENETSFETFFQWNAFQFQSFFAGLNMLTVQWHIYSMQNYCIYKA